MATMNTTFGSDTISVSADRLWKITGEDFDTIARWASGLSASRVDESLTVLDGARVGGRICEIPGSGKLFEQLIAYDAAARSFAFSAKPEKAPGFLKDFRMYWQITEKSSTTSVVSGRATAELEGLTGALLRPMMKLNTNRLMSDLMVDLQTFAETGEVSKKKQKAQNKLAKSV